MKALYLPITIQPTKLHTNARCPKSRSGVDGLEAPLGPLRSRAVQARGLQSTYGSHYEALRASDLFWRQGEAKKEQTAPLHRTESWHNDFGPRAGM